MNQIQVRLTVAVVLLAGLATSSVQAGTPAAHEASDEARVRAKLKTNFPALAIQTLAPANVLGLYELVTNDGIAYVDPSGEHLFIGQIVETQTKRNLTTERWNTVNRVDFDTLPLDKAITTVRGNGTRKVAVFADPDCPYCQELETELAKQDDITIYTFLFPLEELHPGATKKAHQLWCAANRSQAWSDWMLQHQMPRDGDCTDDPIRTLGELGAHLHIESTPTIIFPSGVRAAGLPPKDKFNQLLAAESMPAKAHNGSL